MPQLFENQCVNGVAFEFASRTDALNCSRQFLYISASPVSLLDPYVVCASSRVVREIPKSLTRCQISEFGYRQEIEDQGSAPSFNFCHISAGAAGIFARLGMHGVMALIALHFHSIFAPFLGSEVLIFARFGRRGLMALISLLSHGIIPRIPRSVEIC